MRVFTARNSNDMANRVYTELNDCGVSDYSRNGNVIKFDEPVTMCYTRPWERMNFTPGRNANPFFHLAECAWMLAGRNDVEFLTMFNKGMAEYSDDGKSFNAAYGYRLRNHYGHDQLLEAVQILSRDPTSRQVVLQIWDQSDLTKQTKDKACNLMLLFSIVRDRLQLTVFNRSNDAVFGGVTGANPVHMSAIQQYVADQLERPMGKLYFVSNNLHVYTTLYDHWLKMDWNQVIQVPHTYYKMGDLEEYESICCEVMTDRFVKTKYRSEFIEYILKPVFNTWLLRRNKNIWRPWLDGIQCEATYKACVDWTSRVK